MEVLKLMNTNKNWREILTNEPYNIIIKDYGDYILLGSLIGLSLLFVFLIITVVLVPSSEGNNNDNSNKTVHDEN